MKLGNRQGEEWHRPRRVLSRKMLPLNEVLPYVDVMEQVADDFVERLARVRHQLSDHTDSSTTLELELLQFALECKSCRFTSSTRRSLHLVDRTLMSSVCKARVL